MATAETTTPERQHESSGNIENLPEVERIIASAVIMSADDCVLMGRKDPNRGGVYPHAWHIPGGGSEGNETLQDTVIREVSEEVGLEIPREQLEFIPIIGEGETEKVIDGERVWCKMKFNRFKVRLNKTAIELADMVQPGDDLVELKWISQEELPEIEQIPGGKEFFMEAGIIKP